MGLCVIWTLAKIVSNLNIEEIGCVNRQAIF